VVVLDANVPLYAIDDASLHRAQALSWLDASLAGTEAVAFAWVALLAFIRIIATGAVVFPRPLSVDEATEQSMRGWPPRPRSSLRRHRATRPCCAGFCGTPGRRAT